MQQYFVPGKWQCGQRICLNEEQTHHIVHVLRMREGDAVRIVDEANHTYLAEIRTSGTLAEADLKEELPQVKSPVKITLAIALIKGERWDYAIQKACELGVHCIQPLITRRCVVKFKEDAADKKIRRWNKIALEACEQCKRSDLVEVTSPCTLTELYEQCAEVNLVAYENADHHAATMKKVVMAHPEAKTILCVVGPEGGFAQEEITALLSKGFECISLGPRILRAETAALAIVNTLTVLYE